MHRAFLVCMRISRQNTVWKNLHCYLEISNKKESTANFSGDGPPKGNLLAAEFQILKSLAMQQNGISITKIRKNSPFKIDEIDSSIFQSAAVSNSILITTTPSDQIIGYIVTKINDIDLHEYDNISVLKLLASTKLLSISMFSPIEYKKLRRNNTIEKQILILSDSSHLRQ